MVLSKYRATTDDFLNSINKLKIKRMQRNKSVVSNPSSLSISKNQQSSEPKVSFKPILSEEVKLNYVPVDIKQKGGKF